MQMHSSAICATLWLLPVSGRFAASLDQRTGRPGPLLVLRLSAEGQRCIPETGTLIFSSTDLRLHFERCRSPSNKAGNSFIWCLGHCALDRRKRPHFLAYVSYASVQYSYRRQPHTRLLSNITAGPLVLRAYVYLSAPGSMGKAGDGGCHAKYNWIALGLLAWTGRQLKPAVPRR